jgi:quinol monooxygenase YgiN
MADQIQYAVRWKIHDGKLEEFKALAAEATALVKANEPDMLGYHWYFDASETTCTLIEQYPSAAHILVHLGNVGEALGKLVEVSALTYSARSTTRPEQLLIRSERCTTTTSPDSADTELLATSPSLSRISNN